MVNINWPKFAFELFWQAYPLKVKKARARLALERVQREGKIEFETILVAVKKFAEMIRANPQFCPHPATWINDERWDDEYPEAANDPLARFWATNPDARQKYETTLARRKMQ